MIRERITEKIGFLATEFSNHDISSLENELDKVIITDNLVFEIYSGKLDAKGFEEKHLIFKHLQIQNPSSHYLCFVDFISEVLQNMDSNLEVLKTFEATVDKLISLKSTIDVNIESKVKKIYGKENTTTLIITLCKKY